MTQIIDRKPEALELLRTAKIKRQFPVIRPEEVPMSVDYRRKKLVDAMIALGIKRLVYE